MEQSRRKGIVTVAAGKARSLMLNRAGTDVFCCGRADEGALGIYNTMPAPCAEGVLGLERVVFPDEDTEIERIGCGESASFAITKSGEMYDWGLGDSGALGVGDDADSVRLRKVRLPEGYIPFKVPEELTILAS